MSLELVAQNLASRGRKGDTMLVHMAPQEVSGLQALAKAHGGTLTVNPDTGLPEANFLKRMLPMLIGAALTPLTGGLINPMTAGLLVGGVETARTGDLGKGLMAGLGAYGGAGLGAGLMGAGAQGVGASALDAGMGAYPSTGSLIPGSALDVGMSAYPTAAPVAAAPVAAAPVAAAPTGGISNLFGAATDAAGQPLSFNPVTAPAAAPVAPPVAAPITTATTMPTISSPVYGTEAASSTVGDRFAQAGRGLTSLGTDAGRSAALNAMGGGMGAAKYGLAALSPMLQAGEEKPYVDGGANYEYTYDPNTSRYTQVPVGTRDKMGRTPSYYAVGGPVEEMSYRNEMETMMANGGQMFAAGGISNLGDYSDGGRLLKGPGDGVSDSIPATIADKRPARLADGEFVVPARIVSELGNGSTEAGARKLYAMMDRVQKARNKTTGKNRVAVNSRAEKLLPA